MDSGRVTLGQSESRDLPIPNVTIRVLSFKRLRIEGRSRDAINPTSEIGEYISREDIS